MFARLSYGARDYSADAITALPTDVTDWQRFQNEVTEIIYPAIASRAAAIQRKYRKRMDDAHRSLVVTLLLPETKVMLKDPKYLVNPGMRASSEPIYVGPYTIVRATTHGAYIVKDETGVNVARPVTLDQMKVLYSPDRVPEKAAVVDNKENVYQMQAIISHRENKGALEYLVQWKGYKHASDNTWVRADDINDVNAINMYFRREALKAETGRAKRTRSARLQTVFILSSVRPAITGVDNARTAAALRSRTE